MYSMLRRKKKYVVVLPRPGIKKFEDEGNSMLKNKSMWWSYHALGRLSQL
jgi:hypothetical protein